MKRNTGALARAPKLTLSGVNISKHAMQRALDMAVDGDEIRDCIERPRRAYFHVGKQAWMYSRGRLTLPVAVDQDGTGTVKTVLWSDPGKWRTDEQVAPMPRGRRREDRVAA